MTGLEEARRVAAILEPMLGYPYEVRGKEGGFNCWSFARLLQREAFGRQLEEIDVQSYHVRDLVRLVHEHPAHRNWQLVDRPSHGGLVEMSHSKHPHHIGTWLAIDGSGIAHCQAGAGVSFDPVVALRAAGWRRFSFYEWCG